MIFVWKSKKDYFWFAYFFLLADYPGGFFGGGDRLSQFRLPLYSLGQGFSFSIHQIYFILLFLKYWYQKRIFSSKEKPVFYSEMRSLIFLYFVLILISPILGYSLNTVKWTYQQSIQLTLLITVFNIFNSKTSIVNFFKAISPFVLLSIIFQVFSLVNKVQLVNIFDSTTLVSQGAFNTTDSNLVWERPIELVMTLFVLFTTSLYFIYDTRHNIDKYILIVVNFLSFISMFINGTRSWFIGMAAAYIWFLLFTYWKISSYIKPIIVSVSVVVLVIILIPSLKNQFYNSLSRINTISNIAKGDISAGETAIRWDVRSPAVMEAFYQSTIIFGAGFSDFHYQNMDYHVGYQNILLNAGILGSLVFLIFFWRLILLAKYYSNKLIRFKILPFIGFLPIMVLLIVNFGVQVIGFNGTNFTFYIFPISLALFNVSLKSSRQDFLVSAKAKC